MKLLFFLDLRLIAAARPRITAAAANVFLMPSCSNGTTRLLATFSRAMDHEARPQHPTTLSGQIRLTAAPPHRHRLLMTALYDPIRRRRSCLLLESAVQRIFSSLCQHYYSFYSSGTHTVYVKGQYLSTSSTDNLLFVW